MESKSLKGLDSLQSMVQLPGCAPGGTLAIGKAGLRTWDGSASQAEHDQGGEERRQNQGEGEKRAPRRPAFEIGRASCRERV